MGKCETCGQEGAEKVHHGRLTCQACRTIIGDREPMNPADRPPNVIWKTAVSDFAAWAGATSKILKEFGYHYRCPYCFYVHIGIDRLCPWCRRPKEIIPANLYEKMPVGWA